MVTGPLIIANSSLQLAFVDVFRQLTQERKYAFFLYGGTQDLTNQIIRGAQGDVFAPDDIEHMATIEKAGLLDGAPQVFAHNRLEIAVAKGNPKGIHSLADLARSGLVVVLEQPSEPAGAQAEQALAKAGVTLRPAGLAQNDAEVLIKIELGQADAGILYVSDITADTGVEGIEIPPDQNVITDYYIAVLKHGRHKTEAVSFVAIVLSPAGQSRLTGEGYQAA